MSLLRVLYVDDEPDLLELGKIFLERDGPFTVDTIESAPGALIKLESTKYDAVIADYQMPEMDGIEFLRKVRTSGNQIPFILFTGRGREEVVIQALNEGADFYLQKGGDPMPQFMELSHKVHQAIKKRLAEGMLLESQVQLRTVVDSIPVGIVTIDIETHRILTANKKAIEMIGADADDVVGHVCQEFICPADVGKCPVTDLGQRVDLSERVLLSRKKGKIPILKSVVPSIMDGKEVLIESFFDISERKRSEETFQTLIRSMVGKTGLESLNEITLNVCKWLGSDRAVIMELTPDREHGRILSMQPGDTILPEVLTRLEGTPCGIAVEKGFYLCPDNLQHLFPGLKMPFDFMARSYVGLALHNSAGTVIGAICTFSKNPLIPPPKLQEIFEIIGVKAAAEIERKQAEVVLRQSEERFRVLLQNVPGVAIQGYRMDGTTFFWDEGSEKTYGYPAEEAVGKNLVDLIIPAEMQEEVKGAIAYMAQTGDSIPASELSLMRKDGSRVPVFSSHVILRKPQGEMELYCLDVDLTEHKRSEDALRNANRQLNLLSGITRHDILNKISIILGFLRIVEMKFPDPALGEYLQKIHAATTAIQSQIEFTRVYHDLGTHEPQWIDLDTVIPRPLVTETISLVADVKGIRVFADPMLEKVFSNLLDNAVRHGERVSRIGVSAHISGEALVVIWEDNGIGIAADEKERIFERGFGRNTGLGMFLARDILSLTGITITETGEPGKGARFEITVPKGMFQVAGR